MSKKTIAQIMKNAKNGKSYYRLAKESGLTQAQIEGIETGDKKYTIDSLLKLCHVLNLELKVI